MQLALVLLPTERFLFNLIDLVEPQAIVGFFVLILLSLLRSSDVVRHLHALHLSSPWHVHRLRHDAVTLPLLNPLLLQEACMIGCIGLLIRDLAHLTYHVVFASDSWPT